MTVLEGSAPRGPIEPVAGVPASGAGAATEASPTVAPARLRALRLLGFKSFAERTVLEFGPGISAIVGPNGSGKSNLADALRWALGEQGRSLRTRKSEDVIFAGSARRHAIGMADVTLVIDNEDGLLPLEFAEVDLGRRLFRSGENEYLVNRQRVRFRDLVDLLDAANLADNAFLFIGQGMVDQALSLRPEERRPLFEEVAGVRRHERRRRQAEEQLAEAEANLARVRDILDELRPQARRLAVQAEQQEARRGAAEALATTLVAHARGRWSATLRSSGALEARLGAARTEATQALAALREAERALETATARLAERAAAERSARAELDASRAAQTELRLAHGRAVSAVEAADLELRRLDTERSAIERRADEGRRALAISPAGEDGGDLAERVAAVDAELREAQAEVAALRSAEAASRERREALRRAIAAREAELERSRRRAAETGRRAEADADRAARAAATRERAELERANALAAVNQAERRLEESRAEAEIADRERAGATSDHEAIRRDADRLRARLAALEEALERETGTGLLVIARRHGGERVAEGLEVEPGLRRAVEAALGVALRAVAVSGPAVARLGEARGTLLIREPSGARRAERSGRAAAVVEAAAERGGGRLEDGVVADPAGLVRELLRSAVWVPVLDDALALRPLLPPGWRVATQAGEVVSAEGLVQLGSARSVLDLQAERDDVREALDAAVTAEASAAERAAAARGAEGRAREEHQLARRDADAARAALRRCEEQERVAVRVAETAAREASWAATQAERSRQDLEQARAELARREQDAEHGATRATGTAERGEGGVDAAAGPDGAGPDGVGPDAAALEVWSHRVTQLRMERDRLRDAWEAAQRRRAALEEERRRTEVRLAMDEARLAELDGERPVVVERRTALGSEVIRLSQEVEGAAADVARLAAALDGLAAADQVDRTELQVLEARTVAARERVRRAEEQVRAAEVQGIEGRLQLETIREGLLVELAALGEQGLLALEAEGDGSADPPARPVLVPVMTGAAVAVGATGDAGTADQVGATAGAEDVTTGRLEGALERAIRAWASEDRHGDTASRAEPEPVAPTRLAALRRRYQELGVSNPFAAEEYARIRGRVEELEGQRRDLDSAIAETRRLIAELSQLVSERFQATFRALEGAFGRRFEQLFGGGEARLVLTEPNDLSVTGVEILARPPGKKRQPLAMLSGGERALTAVALLFAMLEVRPVPFCVLDEVDAALDEANINRFAAALRGLAASTQFIVITHNRGTIEAADALYGVTIGDDAVSRIISLRLADLPPKEDGLGPRRTAPLTAATPVGA